MVKEEYVSFETAKLLKEKGFDVKPFHQYYVSKCGKIFGCNGNEMKPYLTKNGYLRLCLTIDGVRRNYTIHRLVALLFIPNPYQKLEVNHIDGNKQNNNVENLEWCTRSENEQHARQNGLKQPVVGKYLGKDNKLSKPFICIETGKIYYCLRELWEELGYDKNCCSHIARACKYGLIDHGFQWRYYEPNELVKLLFEKGYRKYPLSYDGDIWFCYVQMAMRWLREVHNIDIITFHEKLHKDYYWSRIEIFPYTEHQQRIEYTSYEDSVEASIKYCLENLI